MKKSLRRIGNALLTLSILGLTLSFTSSLSFQCGIGAKGCLASLFSFTTYSTIEETMPILSIAQSTGAFPIDGTGWWSFVQLTSGYALLVAVSILIALEFFELYYIRKILGYRKMFRIA
jgi:hypothetical protein